MQNTVLRTAMPPRIKAGVWLNVWRVLLFGARAAHRRVYGKYRRARRLHIPSVRRRAEQDKKFAFWAAAELSAMGYTPIDRFKAVTDDADNPD